MTTPIKFLILQHGNWYDGTQQISDFSVLEMNANRATCNFSVMPTFENAQRQFYEALPEIIPVRFWGVEMAAIPSNGETSLLLSLIAKLERC